MGACASKRSKSQQLRVAEEKYEILACLFATRAQDLANIVTEFDASQKAEELAYDRIADLEGQLEELHEKLEVVEDEHRHVIDEWRLKVKQKEDEIRACRRVVVMRTEERNQERLAKLELHDEMKHAMARERISANTVQEAENVRKELGAMRSEFNELEHLYAELERHRAVDQAPTTTNSR